MRQRMPSINALRAFEAAARHLNFTSAGQELSVTAGAIRNHARALERDLCVRLFTRIGNRFALSEVGKTLLPDLRIAFERMESALMRLHAREPQQVLNVRHAADLRLQLAGAETSELQSCISRNRRTHRQLRGFGRFRAQSR